MLCLRDRVGSPIDLMGAPPWPAKGRGLDFSFSQAVPGAGHHNLVSGMVTGQTLRAQLCEMRRQLIAKLETDFDAGAMLPLLSNINAAIDAIDAEAAESNGTKERYRGD